MNTLTPLLPPLSILPPPHQYLEKTNQGQIIITDLVSAVINPEDFKLGHALKIDGIFIGDITWFKVDTQHGITILTPPLGSFPPAMKQYSGWDKIRFRIKKLDVGYESILYAIEYSDTDKFAGNKTATDRLNFTSDVPVLICVNNVTNEAILHY